MASPSQACANFDHVAAQFDVYLTPQKSRIVIVQSDLLDEMRVRVAAPLLPAKSGLRPIKSLNPEIWIDGEAYFLMPQLLATFSIKELGDRIGSVADERDKIIRAIDTLLAGV